jgi:hypothetical protein
VLSNCYTRVCFRLGDGDAEKFAGGFSFFDAKALQNLGVGDAIARVERAEYDFNLKTKQSAPVPKEIARNRFGDVIRESREKYATPRSEVEGSIHALLRKPATFPKQQLEKPMVRGTGGVEIPKAMKPEPMPITAPTRSPIDVDAREPVEIPIPDKRTTQHKYLQSLIKRMAESKGFLVTIEKAVLGGVGRIDVALERETMKVACEISVTNEPDYELRNIQKCLAAGYCKVVLISADERHLNRIRKNVENSLEREELKAVGFMTPEDFHVWLDNLPGAENASEEKIKGYKVKTRMKPVDEADRKTRKRAISEVVLGAIKRLRAKRDDK